MKIPFGKREFLVVTALLLLAFLVRFAFFSNQGYQIDTNDFMLWFQHAAEVGPRTFYNNNYWCDYPPFNIYFFWIFGLLAENLGVFGSTVFTYVMKLPANLFDLATAFLIFAFIRKRFTFKLALLGTALYAFNPAVVFNTAVWGQFDAIYTFFLVLSLFLVFESKPKWAVVAFMLGVLTKPQGIALAPLIGYLVLKKLNWNWKGTVVSVCVAVATVFAVILPFDWSNPVTFLSSKYFGAYNGYQYTSLNAFNIWAFGGIWVEDTQLTFLLGWTMFAALAAFALYFVSKSAKGKGNMEAAALFAAFVLFFGFFMLPTRMHERYLFPAMAMLALLFPLLKKTRPLYVVLTATCFVNQAFVLDALVAAYPSGPNLTGDPVLLIVSLINSVALVYVIMLMIGKLKGKNWLTAKLGKDTPPVAETKDKET
ncbi:MAG: glycosyltransferase 87 family protein [Candidatus Bathyarchaeota archaeon]|nr:glycosyltransferase 87 family protein [Candidatus Bathyarchaeota archaeon]